MKGIKVPSFNLNPKRRLLKWVLIFVIGTVVILFLASQILSHYATQQIEARLKSIGGKIGSLTINLLLQRVSISEFELNPSADSVKNTPYSAQIKNIVLKDVSLYQLLINKNLKINEVLIADGNILFNRKKREKESESPPKEITLKKVFVGKLILKNLNTTIVNDSLTQCSGMLNLTLNDIQSSDTASIADIKAYDVKNLEAKITHLLINSSNGFYQIKISTAYANSSEQKFQLDSIILVPKYPKYKFAQVAGKQIDRINSFIRRVKISGLHYDHLRDSTLLASKMEITSGELLSFRDKRMPFREKKNKPLPIAALKKINFAIELDTIQIKDSKITYEEFPSDGFESGKVVFENLNATMTNVSNKDYYNKPNYASLEASAKIMGKGLIQASFVLPFNDKTPYHAKGKITKMNLYHLNPALENLAFISVESGTLNALDFEFDYNDKVSNGTLAINYKDLKIKGLKKEKSPAESDLKTFLINTIVKNDKDKSVPIGKRTGTISFERDRKRQIFNFWWKSLLSGIKGSVLNNSNEKPSSKTKPSRKS